MPRALAADPDFVQLWRQGGNFQTAVLVTVNGDVPGNVVHDGAPYDARDSVRRNSQAGHAEEVAIASGDLAAAIDAALRIGRPQEPAVVRFMVNRMTCTRCAQVLADRLQAVLGTLNPTERASVRFELLAPGPFEASEPIPAEAAHLYTAPKQRFADGATTTRSLEVLLEAGWDVRALEVDGTLTERGEWLAGATSYVRDNLGLPSATGGGGALRSSRPPPPTGAAWVSAEVPASALPPSGGAAGAPASAAPPAAAPSRASVEPAASAPRARGGATGPPQMPPPGPPAAAAGQPAGEGEPWQATQSASQEAAAAAEAAAAISRQAAQLGRQLAASSPRRSEARRLAAEAASSAHGAAVVAHQAAQAAAQAYQAAYELVRNPTVTRRLTPEQAAQAEALGRRAAEAAYSAHQLAQEVYAADQASRAAADDANVRREQTSQAAGHAASLARRAAALAEEASLAARAAVGAATHALIQFGASPVRAFGRDVDADEYGARLWSQIGNRLTDARREAVSFQAGAGSELVNGYLRGRFVQELLGAGGSEPVEQAIRRIPSLDAALAVQPTVEDVMVHTVASAADFDRPLDGLAGSVQTDPAYLSASLSPAPQTSGVPDAVVLHLAVPAGTPALHVPQARRGDDPSSQSELILGRGLSYLVESVVQVDGRWHAYGRVLPRDAAMAAAAAAPGAAIPAPGAPTPGAPTPGTSTSGGPPLEPAAPPSAPSPPPLRTFELKVVGKDEYGMDVWDGQAYGRAVWADAHRALTPEEQGALLDYGGSAHTNINRFLETSPDRWTPSQRAELESIIADLDRAMHRQPVPEWLLAVRATNPFEFPKPMDQLAVGDVVHARRYLSTALRPRPAHARDWAQVHLYLEVPPGTPGFFMEGPGTTLPGLRPHLLQGELVLGRGLSYEILEPPVQDSEGRWQVRGRILPPEPR